MEEVAQQRAQSEQALAALATNHDQLSSEIQQAEQQWAQAQQELAKLTEDMAARNRDLAEVDGKLQSAWQELADTQSNLAAVRQQLVFPSAPTEQPGGPVGEEREAAQSAPASEPE